MRKVWKRSKSLKTSFSASFKHWSGSRGSRSTSMILILIMFAGLLLLPYEKAAGTVSDQFTAMYDSDAMFKEQIAPLLEEKLIRMELEVANSAAAAPGDKQNPPGKPGSDGIWAGEHRNKLEQAVESALDIAKQCELSAAVDSFFFEDAELIENIYENTRVDRFIVKYKNNSTSINNIRGLNIQSTKSISRAKNSGGAEIELIKLAERVNPADFANILRDANLDGNIEYIQPDFLMEYAGYGLSVEANEPSKQPPDSEVDTGTKQEDEPLSGEDNKGSSDSQKQKEEDTAKKTSESAEIVLPEISGETETREILVALIDTGVDIYHEALQEHITGGWNFVDGTADVFDPASPMSASHGTHIAGIIAQYGGEHVKILPLQVFGPNGAYTSDIIDAIIYAGEHGASIANMSFGSTSYNQALYETMSTSGIFFVAAAGNSRSDLAQSPVYPAAFELENTVSAASVNADGGFSYYSNYSTELIDIAAQGRDIYSTLPGNKYGTQTGTSMSAGYVTAVAAAVSVNRNLSACVLKTRLLDTADMLSNLQNKVSNGRMINLANAINNIVQTQIIQNAPEDDFDVHGYQPTQSELYELFNTGGNIIKVAAGGDVSLALLSNGTVLAWGYNYWGQCGNGSYGSFTVDKSIFQVIGLTNVVAIEAGPRHCFAIKSDGTLWAWGYNYYGELGNGTTKTSGIPLQVLVLTDVTAVSPGKFSSISATSDGTLFAWGSHSTDIFGNGVTVNPAVPTPVYGMTNVTSVAAGDDHCLISKADGSVWAWGANSFGELGDGTTITRTVPVQVQGLTGVKQVAAGREFSLALKTDKTVYAWGSNTFGKLGNGVSVYSPVPIQIQAGPMTNTKSISAGNHHSLAVEYGGTPWAWGFNFKGMLGDGTTDDYYVPINPVGLTDVIDVAAGAFHSLALRSDGTVWGCGENMYGQLGPNVPNIKIPTQLFELASVATTELTVTQGDEYRITLSAWNIASFSGKTITVTYDPAKLQLVNAADQVYGTYSSAGAIPGTALTLALPSSGTVELTSGLAIPQGKTWAGVVTVLKFKALAAGTTEISAE